MKIWRKTAEYPEGKYLVVRRDGSIPEWEHFVLGDRDKAAPAALRAYADKAEELGYEKDYVQSVRDLAIEFEETSKTHAPVGRPPDQGPHRRDNPGVLALMRREDDLKQLVVVEVPPR